MLTSESVAKISLAQIQIDPDDSSTVFGLTYSSIMSLDVVLLCCPGVPCPVLGSLVDTAEVRAPNVGLQRVRFKALLDEGCHLPVCHLGRCVVSLHHLYWLF